MFFNFSKLQRNKPKGARVRINHAYFWVATAGGAGLLPAAGTWGSLVALPFGFGLAYLGGWPALVGGIILVTALGTLAANWYEAESKSHDASAIVVDEVAGMWITCIGLAADFKLWTLWALAFIMFRIFDIIKPWPIGMIDRKVGGGWGVMLDDIVAGVMALISVKIIIYFGVL